MCSIRLAGIPGCFFSIRVYGEYCGLNVCVTVVVTIMWVFWTYHGHYCDRISHQVFSLREVIDDNGRYMEKLESDFHDMFR